MSDLCIYRIEPPKSGSPPPDGVTFVPLTNPWHGARHFHALRSEFGLAKTLRALLKLLSGSRFLFVFLQRDRIVCYIWSTEHSPRYPIGPQACVLGPLSTQRAMRGRGLASSLMRLASEHLAARGYREIYTDTVPSNVASQRTILRAGFVPCAIPHTGGAGPHAP
jgi:GNAT superfamily N-acetyltransferase